jgi:hypothetical protein
MADGYKLWQVCPICNGTGVISFWTGDGSEERSCPKCAGVKYIFFGWCSVDTFTLPADLPDAP